MRRNDVAISFKAGIITRLFCIFSVFMIGDTFKIVISPFSAKHSYRMDVEITYATENVIRFKITAGKKMLEMDKQIYRKSNQWKVTRYETSNTKDPKVVAESILLIQSTIDRYLKKNYPTLSGK